MKTLTQAWELIQLLSSLHFLSPSLVRATNPQTYTLNCVYSEEEVSNNDNLEGSKYIKHIVTCRDRSCNYYQRLVDNTKPSGETAGGLILGATVFALSFATGGLSILAIAALSAASMAGGDFLIENDVKKTIEEIENELKEKWEAEQCLNTERSDK
jgi:hypothetical protein